MVAARLRLPPLPTIKDILNMYRIHAMRRLSQNFLMDQNLTNKIVKRAGNMKDMYVCEVGPGPGGITRSILQAGVKHLSVIEKDDRFLPCLEMLAEASNERMRIYQGDILTFKLESLFPPDIRRPWNEEPPNIHIIGNLPFNVSTPLAIKWLRQISERSGVWDYGRVRLTLTFQKEVAERMVAPMLHKQRCRLSVMCQSLCWVKHQFNIPGKAFLPKPDVDVAVVTFEPLRQPRIGLPFILVEKVVGHVFHHRQKMCKYGLGTLFPVGKRTALTEELCSRSEVNPETLPYQLDMDSFKRICHVYQQLCERDPTLSQYYFRSKEAEDELRQYREIKRAMKRSLGTNLGNDLPTEHSQELDLLQEEFEDVSPM